MEMYEKLSSAELPDFIMSAYRNPMQELRVFFFREEKYVSPEKEQQNAERLSFSHTAGTFRFLGAITFGTAKDQSYSRMPFCHKKRK